MLRAVAQSLKIVSIAVIAGLIVIGGVRFFDYYRGKAAAEEHIGQKVVVTIGKDEAVSDVAKKLHTTGLIKNELYFTTLMKLNNGEIKPATYTFTKGASVRTIADLITTTKSVAKTDNKDLKLTVPEGWRATQIAEELDKIGWAPGGRAFLDATKSYQNDQYPYLADRSDKHSLEGFLFPDTYDIKSDTTPNELIDKMLLDFDTKFGNDMRAQAKTDGLTIDQVLILASIVEREAVVSSERPIIASVYMNRFQGTGAMGADPTVQYAVGNKANWWPVLTDANLKVDSPYNTYTHDGLPPSPICNPGLPSILATLQPAQTNYLYFVAKKDGSNEHVFAETAAEHEANKAQYGNGGASTTDSTSTDSTSTDSTQIQPVDGNSGGG